MTNTRDTARLNCTEALFRVPVLASNLVTPSSISLVIGVPVIRMMCWLFFNFATLSATLPPVAATSESSADSYFSLNCCSVVELTVTASSASNTVVELFLTVSFVHDDSC